MGMQFSSDSSNKLITCNLKTNNLVQNSCSLLELAITVYVHGTVAWDLLNQSNKVKCKRQERWVSVVDCRIDFNFQVCTYFIHVPKTKVEMSFPIYCPYGLRRLCSCFEREYYFQNTECNRNSKRHKTYNIQRKESTEIDENKHDIPIWVCALIIQLCNYCPCISGTAPVFFIFCDTF